LELDEGRAAIGEAALLINLLEIPRYRGSAYPRHDLDRMISVV